MKLLKLTLVFVFILSAAFTKKDSSHYQPRQIIGTWRWYGNAGNDGAKNYENKVADTTNKYLIFYKNGVLGGNYFKNGPRHYQFKKDTLIVTTNTKFKAKYFYGIEKNRLYLSFTEIFCDERCAIIFTKVTNP